VLLHRDYVAEQYAIEETLADLALISSVFLYNHTVQVELMQLVFMSMTYIKRCHQQALVQPLALVVERPKAELISSLALS
jgi:hypothetical protein